MTMRIAHFVQGRCNPDSANGVDKTVYFLSRAQAARGEDVRVFALSEKHPLPIEGVEVRHFRRTFRLLGAPPLLIDAIRAWHPDFVHLHSAYVPPNVTVARAMRRSGIPYAVTPNGVLAAALLRRRPYVKVPYKYLFERPLLSHAAFVHSVGDTAEIKRYGVVTPIVEVPNGFDLERIPRSLDASRLRRELGIGPERIALYVGRLDIMQKGLDLLLRGFAVAAAGGGVRLVLVGPDWKGGRRRLERLALDLDLSDRAIFWGPAFDRMKFELLAGADFFVHASRWEGLSFAIVEALALRKPCLVTPAADPLGLVGRYKAGRVVESDPASIAAGIREMADWDEYTLRAAGERSRSVVEEHLSWTQIAEQLSAAYATYRGARA
jgi:glycosyltransferase involved in cell wall biosynthesis